MSAVIDDPRIQGLSAEAARWRKLLRRAERRIGRLSDALIAAGLPVPAEDDDEALQGAAILANEIARLRSVLSRLEALRLEALAVKDER